MAPEMGQSSIVLAAVWHDSGSCVENTLQLDCRFLWRAGQ